MSNDVKLVIVGTFVIIGLAWVLTNSGGVQTVTTSLASSYSTAVGALKPGNS